MIDNSALNALLQGNNNPLYNEINFSLIEDVNKKLKSLIELSSINKSGIDTSNDLSDTTHHSFEETKYIDNLEILTDSGFVPIKSVSKTIEYDVWEIVLSSGKSLKCADDHIIFIGDKQTYVKELSIGDKIKTIDGEETVVSVKPLGFKDKLYDVEVNDFKHRFYSNRILSHNSLVISNLSVRCASLGSNVGVYSVELGDRKYVKRIGSNMFGIPFTYYNDYIDENSTQEVQKCIDEYKKNNPNAGVLVVKEAPTGSQTVYDIENYFLKEEKRRGIHFDVIFVDYINLLRDINNEETMYMKIKKICEGLRKIAQRNNWCVVSATQAKQSMFTTNDLQLDSVAESAGLVATVDTLFGLSSDDEETLKVKCVANRDNGHMGSYAMFKKNFNFYRLEEDVAFTGDTDYMHDLDNTKDLLKKQVIKDYDASKAECWSPDKNTQFKIDGELVFNKQQEKEVENNSKDNGYETYEYENSQSSDMPFDEEIDYNLGANDPLVQAQPEQVGLPHIGTNKENLVEPVYTEGTIVTFEEPKTKVNTTAVTWNDIKNAQAQPEVPSKQEVVNDNVVKNNFSSSYLVNTFETQEEHDEFIKMDPGNVDSVFGALNDAITKSTT